MNSFAFMRQMSRHTCLGLATALFTVTLFVHPSIAHPPGDCRPTFTEKSDFGYSQCASFPSGRTVLTAGQVALSATGEPQFIGDWEGQIRLTFENVGRALASAGASWSDVVRLRHYVTGLEEYSTIRAIRDEFIDTDSPPTMTLVQVVSLVLPEFLIEVEAEAWLPDGRCLLRN